MSEHTIDQQMPTTADQHTPSTVWRERYSGDSPEAEYEEFQQLAHDVMEVQMITRNRVSSHGVPHPIQRAFHAKATLAVPDAELQIHDDLPPDLRAGFVQPGARYRATVRYSNASGSGAADFAPDLRGIALRIAIDDS